MKARIAIIVCVVVALALGLTTFSAGKQAAAGYSAASLKGSYAGIFNGQIATPNAMLPIYGTGVFVADGAGRFSGQEYYTVSGTPCTATVSGTYKVNADGTGALAAEFVTKSPGCVSGAYTQFFAIAQGGRLVVLTNSNADRITETWYLQ